jgi:hypothetical protein
VTKWEPGGWGYNWVTLSLWDINTGTWYSRLKTLLCKKIVTKSKEVKTRCNLVESFMKVYDSERAVLPKMMIANKLEFY